MEKNQNNDVLKFYEVHREMLKTIECQRYGNLDEAINSSYAEKSEYGRGYFGVVDLFRLSAVIPSFCYNSKSYISFPLRFSDFPNGEMILIFKKLENGNAQELLTGKEFFVENGHEYGGFLSKDEFDFSNARDAYLGASSIGKTMPIFVINYLSFSHEPKSFYPISTKFKKIYSDYVFENKDYIVKVLNDMEKDAIEKANISLNDIKNKMAEIAYAENIIWDFEAKGKTLVKKI